MRRFNLKSALLLGLAPVYRAKDGTLVTDTDKLQRANRAGLTAGDDDDDFGLDVGEDDDYFGLDVGDDDDEAGDDDDEMGLDVGDDDDIGRRGRRGRRGRKAGPRQRQLAKLAKALDKRARAQAMAGFNYFTTISARGNSALIIGAGGTEAELLTLTPTVTIKLNDLRIDFLAPSPAVAGSNPVFLVNQIRVGDDLIWNDDNGVASTFFGSDNTLRHTLAGRFATPAQPIFVAGTYLNAGSVATATVCTVLATVTGKKRRTQQIYT